MNAYWHKDCICTINTYERVGQSVTYHSADTCLSADPGSQVLSRPGPTEIDLEIMSTVIDLSLSSRRFIVIHVFDLHHKIIRLYLN